MEPLEIVDLATELLAAGAEVAKLAAAAIAASRSGDDQAALDLLDQAIAKQAADNAAAAGKLAEVRQRVLARINEKFGQDPV